MAEEKIEPLGWIVIIAADGTKQIKPLREKETLILEGGIKLTGKKDPRTSYALLEPSNPRATGHWMRIDFAQGSAPSEFGGLRFKLFVCESGAQRYTV